MTDPRTPAAGYLAPTITGTGGGALITSTATGVNSTVICPDLLSIRHLGVADGWRGRVVRGVFHVLRVVTGV